MSVWKKASKVNQKVHRERHQPEHRKHLGLLEKKKDYVKRARDYDEKQNTLKLLRKRALNKNPDEFYHHMINSKLVRGVHHEKDTREAHSAEQLKIINTQDDRYVNMKRVIEMRKIEKLQSQLHLIDVKVPKNHKLFFSSKQELAEYQTRTNLNSSELESMENLESLDDYNSELEENQETEQDDIIKSTRKTYKQLHERINREKQLMILQQKLDIRKYLRTNKKCFPPRKIASATENQAPVYKWKSQRKK